MARDFIRRPYAFPLAFSLAANAGANSLPVIGDTGVITVFTHIAFKSTGPFLFQIRPSDLNAGLFADQISSETVLALLDRPGMLPAPIAVKGSNSLRLDFTNDFGAIINAVKFTLWGYRDFVKPASCK